MSRLTSRMVLTVSAVVCLAADAPAQQTSTATATKTFEIIAVYGNQLVVTLPEGTRELTVPPDFSFNVDGRQMSLNELTPGMKGTATVTTRTTVTPITVTEVKNGRVVNAAGGAIYVRTDEGVKMFTQGDVDKRGVKIMRGGKPATVADFRAGDTLSATIITSKPPQIVTEREVQALLARTEPEPTAAPAAAAGATPVAAAGATPVAAAGAATAAAPPPAPAAAPRAAPPEAAAAAAGSTAPAQTASFPSATAPTDTSNRWLLVGLAGFVFLVAAAFVVRRRRVPR